MQTLQALAALSQYSQVLLAIPNPCRFHWADLIQGRERSRSFTISRWICWLVHRRGAPSIRAKWW
jgi:exonuclease V gamma subunit